MEGIQKGGRRLSRQLISRDGPHCYCIRHGQFLLRLEFNCETGLLLADARSEVAFLVRRHF
jgi:hypothetical protein